MKITDAIQNVDSGALGKVALTGSGLGFIAQWLTDYGAPLVIALNILLGIGGLFLLGLKIWNEWRRRV